MSFLMYKHFPVPNLGGKNLLRDGIPSLLEQFSYESVDSPMHYGKHLQCSAFSQVLHLFESIVKDIS